MITGGNEATLVYEEVVIVVAEHGRCEEHHAAVLEAVDVVVGDLNPAHLKRIGREFHPQRVILFGSYADGTATDDSDIDILVVMQFEGNAIDKSVEIRLKINLKFAIDLLVRTPDMIQKRISMGDGFMQNILQQGKVLYEADRRRVG